VCEETCAGCSLVISISAVPTCAHLIVVPRTAAAGSLEDITAALDESLVTINTVLGSRFCAHIRSDVENYQKRLMLLSETLDEWLNCQKQWMYLEAILFADDIKRDLPEVRHRQQ